MTDEHNDNEQDGNGAGAESAVAEVTKRAMTRKSLELPRADFADVRPLVVAMRELNGPASRKLIFDQADAAASGGTAKKKWAALGYYGFRQDLDDGRSDISGRGRAFLSDDTEVEREAKQHALVATGFRSLIDRFSGSPVKESAIAGVLQDALGVPEAKTKSAAALLVALATEAGFIQDGSFKVAPIEQAMASVPQSDRKPALARASRAAATSQRRPAPQPQPQPRRQPPEAPGTPRQSADATPPPRSEGQAGPFGVSVEIKIDAKDHTPGEIGRILREAREALEATAD